MFKEVCLARFRQLKNADLLLVCVGSEASGHEFEQGEETQVSASERCPRC
jgi:hypothetical protein